MADPQFFKAPDGTEMVIIERARYEALLEAEEDADDLAAAEEGRASIAAEGWIPLEVSAAIANGVHPIAAWRRFRQLSQAALGDAAGMTQGGIARLEKSPPGSGRPENIAAIAAALDAPVWSLENVATSAAEPAAHVAPLPATGGASAPEIYHTAYNRAGWAKSGLDYVPLGDLSAVRRLRTPFSAEWTFCDPVDDIGIHTLHTDIGMIPGIHGPRYYVGPVSDWMNPLAPPPATGIFGGEAPEKPAGRAKSKT